MSNNAEKEEGEVLGRRSLSIKWWGGRESFLLFLRPCVSSDEIALGSHLRGRVPSRDNEQVHQVLKSPIKSIPS